MVLERYYQKPFSNIGWINRQAIHSYSDKIIEQYDVRSKEDGECSGRNI